jgi:glycosyltransferase involved in cell wall biosynthesis
LVEKALERVTDVIPFESAYVEKRFAAAVGLTRATAVAVPNGLRPEEFEPVEPAPDAAEFLYVGEWRRFKGIDTLIEALALIRAESGETPRLVLVGSGPDEAPLRALAERRGVFEQLTFVPPMPAREALRRGRVLVVPSRAESLPYIVLEAIAARAPIVATSVGGIPQIFGPFADRLVECDRPAVLARAMIASSRVIADTRPAICDQLAAHVRENFSLATMTDAVLRAYRDAIAHAESRRRDAGAPAPQRV